jgi:hypothetical protein
LEGPYVYSSFFRRTTIMADLRIGERQGRREHKRTEDQVL